jgi:nucleotide-binding universal stress UspA family protein
MYKRILLPTDGSELSSKAIEKGVEFAKSSKANAIGFFCVPDYRALMYSDYIPPSVMSQDEFEANAKNAAEKQLAFVEQTAKTAGVPYEGYYLTTSHGRTGMSALLLGSQTAKVLAHSKIPVLVYR